MAATAHLVAARADGRTGPVHAVEALIETTGESLLDVSTLCERLATYETDAVAAYMDDRRFLAVAVEERCATCSFVAGARDAGMPGRVVKVDATPKGRPLDGDRWDLPPLRAQPDA